LYAFCGLGGVTETNPVAVNTWFVLRIKRIGALGSRSTVREPAEGGAPCNLTVTATITNTNAGSFMLNQYTIVIKTAIDKIASPKQGASRAKK
jgi:hypothetical protein